MDNFHSPQNIVSSFFLHIALELGQTNFSNITQSKEIESFIKSIDKQHHTNSNNIKESLKHIHSQKVVVTRKTLPPPIDRNLEIRILAISYSRYLSKMWYRKNGSFLKTLHIYSVKEIISSIKVIVGLCGR